VDMPELLAYESGRASLVACELVSLGLFLVQNSIWTYDCGIRT
jgi:hypothetical protein